MPFFVWLANACAQCYSKSYAQSSHDLNNSDPTARHMPVICRSYAGHMPGICWAFAEHMPGICQAYAGHMPGIRRTYAGHMLGVYPAYAGHVLGIYPAYVAHMVDKLSDEAVHLDPHPPPLGWGLGI